jgi:hypothetical protein
MAVQSWSDYVRRVTGTLTQVQISEQDGLAQSNVGRWLRGERGIPRAESVIAFARAFGQPPLEAMVAAGYITEAEARQPARTPLSQYSTEEIFDELRSRTAG